MTSNESRRRTGRFGDASATEAMDLYRELLDSFGAVVWEAEPDARQFVGLDTIQAEDRTRVLAACLRSIERCTGDRIEYRVVAPDGRTRWIRNAFRTVCENGRARRLVGATVDVTDRHEQRHRERHYRALVESSADAVALVSGDGTIRFVTESVEPLSGYTPDELIGSPVFDRIHPDDRAAVTNTFQRALEEPGVMISVEYRGQHRDGSWRHREIIGVNRLDDPAVAAVVVNYRDTTAHKVAEAALLERERVYRATFDEALIGLAQTSLDGRFLLVNRRLCDLLGYTVDELRAIDFVTISHPDEVAADVDASQRLIAGTIDRYTREKRYRRKDGSFVWANLTVSLHLHASGEPSYFIAVIEDITERKHSEEEARQLHKMEAMGRLAGGIAHDFNNLLTVIVGYGDLVLNQLKTDDPVRRDIQEIRRAGESAAALTRQLLAFSRKQLLQPQVLDLNMIVSRMNGLLRRLIGEHIRFEWRPEQRLDRVKADPGQIEQVILNLALNARDAMPRGGTLSIETANVELDRTYASNHPGAAVGKHVMLAVSDTGIGMDDAVRKQVFEPFYTTKELGKGTGLGLATVYGIVKQSGGTIFVDSEPEQGTTFKMFLPCAKHVAEVVSVQPRSTGVIGGSETILLVEDQPEVRAVARAALARHGYTVLEASHGGEALQIALDRTEEIHLLLTDVVMPAMSGRELAQRLLLQRPHVRVLYTSGYTDDAIVHHDVIESGVAFIQKPFTPANLLRKVREVLDGRP
jgi:two-component system cell cycle sensor histidine kinase/response regulator CckA